MKFEKNPCGEHWIKRIGPVEVQINRRKTDFGSARDYWCRLLVFGKEVRTHFWGLFSWTRRDRGE